MSGSVKGKSAAKKTAGRGGRKSAERPTASRGIGAYASTLIERGKSTDEVLKAVAKKFPEAATSRSSVSWYRSKLRAEGKIS